MQDDSSNSTREWSHTARDAWNIWKTGVSSVDSCCLVIRQIDASQNKISISGIDWQPKAGSQICVVGAGKAGAGMAAAVEEALGGTWLGRTTGWVNVPEDCVRPLKKIHLHPARPAGRNEPTLEGVQGTNEILRRVSELNEDDLCLVLISGGGSALLPAPVDGVSLEAKLEVIRLLMRSGATISELNTVRRAISQVKGGGLLRACQAGCMVTLIISDVIGDPLETIASGPTVDIRPDPVAARSILGHYFSQAQMEIPTAILNALDEIAAPQKEANSSSTDKPKSRNVNIVIGNNHTAVEAASREAQRLGYTVCREEWDQPGDAAACGRELANAIIEAQSLADSQRRVCLISGGEPTVKLAETSGPQKGGRNQELVLAATVSLLEQHRTASSRPSSFALISGGTDGEDGPTDAAGAMIDAPLLTEIRQSGLNPDDFLRVNNSYPFFDQFGALIKTGPTHTNVMDVRVVLISNETDLAATNR